MVDSVSTVISAIYRLPFHNHFQDLQNRIVNIPFNTYVYFLIYHVLWIVNIQLIISSKINKWMKWKRDIWTNYLSDSNKVLASNQSGGGKHPLGLPKLMYHPRKLGGRGLKSVEKENEQTRNGWWLSCTIGNWLTLLLCIRKVLKVIERTIALSH